MPELISVIVPIYNIEKYLQECIVSIVDQKYTNLEIILVDDGSTDHSGKICDEWADNDTRIRVIHQKNQGVSNARNAGLCIAAGQYISFVDGDDRLDKTFYSKMIACIKDNKAEIAICGFIDYPYGANIPVSNGITPHKTCEFKEAVVPILERHGYQTSSWNKLYKRSCIEQNGKIIMMDSTLDYGEDEVWLFEILRNCKRIAFLPETLYVWRFREESITRLNRVTAKQLTIFKAKEKTLELLPKDCSIQRLAKGRMYNDCYYLKIQTYCCQDWESYSQICKALAPIKRDWLLSKDPSMMRKIKYILIDMGMNCHAPSSWIKMINNFKRKNTNMAG